MFEKAREFKAREFNTNTFRNVASNRVVQEYTATCTPPYHADYVSFIVTSCRNLRIEGRRDSPSVACILFCEMEYKGGR